MHLCCCFFVLFVHVLFSVLQHPDVFPSEGVEIATCNSHGPGLPQVELESLLMVLYRVHRHRCHFLWCPPFGGIGGDWKACTFIHSPHTAAPVPLPLWLGQQEASGELVGPPSCRGCHLPASTWWKHTPWKARVWLVQHDDVGWAAVQRCKQKKEHNVAWEAMQGC